MANLPPHGPVIICCNHLSWLDPPLVAASATRRIDFMAKQELFGNIVFAAVMRGLKAFPVKRGSADKAAIREALMRLASGKVIGMFPEGTRAHDLKLQAPHNGAALLAYKSGAPVVPVGIVGPYIIGRPVIIRYGKPMVFGLTEGSRLTSEHLRLASGRIMEAISGLLQSALEGTKS